VWIGARLLVAGVIFLAQPLLLIIGGLVFAVVLDGGTRLLGRVLPIGAAGGWRSSSLLGFGFIGWVFYYAGTTFAAQAEALRAVVERRSCALRLGAATSAWSPTRSRTARRPAADGLGRAADHAVGSALGALTSAILILVIGIFIAIEPRLYDRGVAWMLPLRHRDNSTHHRPRRLHPAPAAVRPARRHGGRRRLHLGMLALLGIGVPMAALLGLLTGLLAFIPNIGAIVSGVLMVAVGFSAGPTRAVGDRRLFRGAEHRRLSDPALHRPQDGRPGAGHGACGAADLRRLFGFLGLLLADSILGDAQGDALPAPSRSTRLRSSLRARRIAAARSRARFSDGFS
jgi:hypothetical protein